MQPVTIVTGPGVALPLNNIDTDQLIPARFMSRSRSEGYGDQFMYDLRFDEDGGAREDFPLNRLPELPAVLVAGDNFGCGSSREAAVYALLDHGIRVVVAPSFADIFRTNAARNGLLTISPAETDHVALVKHLEATPGAIISVDLEAQIVSGDELEAFSFPYDPALKRRLLLGLDDLTETLEHEPAIRAFERVLFQQAPWTFPVNPIADP